jgi:hypothetical protein
MSTSVGVVVHGGRLPFGRHKWRAQDPELWEPYLLA